MNKLDDLQHLCTRFSANLAYYKNTKNNYNEHSCRIEYIDPLLKCLGWDVANEKGLPPQYREVIAENYSTQMDRPDYSLTLKGVTKFFVEAKKPSVDIIALKDPAFQTRRYGWNANHKLSVLTNFEYLLLYDTTFIPHADDGSAFACYRKYHFTEYVEKFDEIAMFLSRDAVYSGDFDRYIDTHFGSEDGQKQQVDELFLAQINHWRLSLSNYLYATNLRYRVMEKLNDVVQEFINQIVFLRICEDKNLPLYHKLKEAAHEGALLRKKLEELFRAAARRYNAKLFEGDAIIFDLENSIIVDMIESLYYPKSPYLFNMIEPNLLGKIYEAFLTEQLSMAQDETIVLSKKKECQNRSIVTTPVEIVKYMASKTLHNLCAGKTPAEVKELSIADVACGSGVFLVEAYNYLVEYCIAWYQEHDPDHLIDIGAGRKKLPLEEKKEIVCSCIYGVDIDIHAVEVAKFSLIVKLIEDETEPSVMNSIPILPDLSDNILYGNSLIDGAQTAQLHLSTDELLEMAPFDWEDINSGRPFDAIIGNPPYVHTEDMHALLPEMEFALYKKRYKTAYKQFDKYFLFLERALELVRNGGYICYIIPNKFIKIKAGEKLRELIASHQYLASLADFGDTQLFEDKTTYTAIMLLCKERQERFEYMKVQSVAGLWSEERKEAISFQSNILGAQPWRLTPDFEFLKLLQKLDETAVPISKHAEIFNGIQTSAERPKPVYWFSADEIVKENAQSYIVRKDGQEYSIEKAILRPYFKPATKSEKGLNSYSPIRTDKWIIFPYDAQGRLIPIHTMQREFPGAYGYLQAYYDRLVPKCVSPKGVRDVPNATADTWYQYGRTQALTVFTNTPKLIVGVLSKEPMYAFDDQDMLIASGGTAGYCAVTVKPDSPYALEYIQAWLSNAYTEKILETVGSDFEGGFIARGTFVLSTLPFIELDMTNVKQKAAHDHVVEETRRIYQINALLENAPEKRVVSTLEKEKIRLIKSIENTIGEIYTLSGNGMI